MTFTPILPYGNQSKETCPVLRSGGNSTGLTVTMNPSFPKIAEVQRASLVQWEFSHLEALPWRG